MTWYVVFHGQKHGVYDSSGVYSEYILMVPPRSYLTRMEAEEAYVAFLELQNKDQKPEHVVLKRLGDISVLCSHCCLMVPDQVTYMF
jgi:hypothetical protein